jgi:hypothetical protein
MYLCGLIPVLRLKARAELNSLIEGTTSVEEFLGYIEEKLDIIEYEKVTGFEWQNHHRRVLHCFMLNSKSREALDAEREKLERIFDPSSQERAEDKDRIRHEYIREVVDMHKNLRRGTRMPKSLLQQTNEKFDFASSIIGV